MEPDTDRDIGRELTSLEASTLDDMRLCWQNRFGRVAPALPKHLLLRLYAYRLQAETRGDLTPATVQFLDRLGRENVGEGRSIPLPTELQSRGLKIGTVLVREHAEVSHRVIVTPDGYCWNGQTFSSLSQVATAITGTRWNGPRFFGLPSRKTAT